MDLAREEGLIEIVSQLIGPDVILWGCQVFCKPGGDGIAGFWDDLTSMILDKLWTLAFDPVWNYLAQLMQSMFSGLGGGSGLLSVGDELYIHENDELLTVDMSALIEAQTPDVVDAIREEVTRAVRSRFRTASGYRVPVGAVIVEAEPA